LKGVNRFLGSRAKKAAFHFGDGDIEPALPKLAVEIPNLITERAYCELTCGHLVLFVQFVTIRGMSCRFSS
jgi:hypothetical protein